MTHYALIDKNNIVKQVIVAEKSFIETLDNSKNWIQTSYNTRGGINKRTGKPIRKNFAGIGYTFDKQKDAFIPPRPYKSWKLNNETCLWNSPIPKPKSKTKTYLWNETKKEWYEEK